MFNFDNDFTSKLFGFKDANDYYSKTSPHLIMHKITVPTLFINSWDDPVMGKSFYDPELFKKSKYSRIINLIKFSTNVAHYNKRVLFTKK